MNKKELLQMRLDKWLKIARIFKTRTEASDAVDGGAVKINGERTKPAKLVRIGDVLTVRQGNKYRTIKIKVVTEKQVKASLAREYYEEERAPGITPEMEEMIQRLDSQASKNRTKRKGKPDKKERRAINRVKYGGR
jgi:ribosome-associated heat shock protein Hsp15